MKQYRRAFCDIIRANIERFKREDIVVAEIGIKRAETSAEVMAMFPKIKMLLVDPWERLPDSHPSIAKWGDVPYDQPTWDILYSESVKNLMPFRGQWILFRMRSEDAAQFIANDSVHALMIDSDHFACGEEIQRWWPKIMPGGVLLGDDYSSKRAALSPPEKRRWDTRLAPLEFEKQTGLKLEVDGRVWSFQKPA